MISDVFEAARWREVGLTGLTDVTYHRGIMPDGSPAPVVRVAFNRPEVRNAFRPQTVDQLYRCLDHARQTASVAAVLLTGNGPAADGGYAFCSGGDQRVRGRDGYQYHVTVPKGGSGGADMGADSLGASDNSGYIPENQGQRTIQEGDVQPQMAPHAVGAKASTAGRYPTDLRAGDPNAGETSKGDRYETDVRDAAGRYGRLHILEVQRLIRATPKPVIALVNGWAAGGGHSLVMVCDLALASREHARFKQVDANVGSFDAGYGSGLLARQVGDKRAREIFFLAETYDAQTAERWGVVNRAVAHRDLERMGWEWALMIAGKSPQAVRMLKFAFNAVDDGLAGMQMFAGEATRLAYGTAEAREGRDSFLERRPADFSAFPYYY